MEWDYKRDRLGFDGEKRDRSHKNEGQKFSAGTGRGKRGQKTGRNRTERDGKGTETNPDIHRHTPNPNFEGFVYLSSTSRD